MLTLQKQVYEDKIIFSCNFYSDVFRLIPLRETIAKSATSVDTIVLRLEKASYDIPPLQNVLDVFDRTTDFMLNQIANEDLIISQLEGKNHNVNVNFLFHQHRELTTSSFLFNKEEISIWWQEDFELFKAFECKSHLVNVKTQNL